MVLTLFFLLNSNFELNDWYNNFKSMKIKFTALNHRIETEKNKKMTLTILLMLMK